MKTLTYAANQIVFKQGDFPVSMFSIEKGKVGIFAKYGEEGQKEVAVLCAGDVLGEMGMLEIYPRSATAVALEDDTVLEEITEADLTEFFKDKPDQLLKIMKQLSRRIRETNEKYLNVCQVAYENAQAEKNGEEKSEWLKDQIKAICDEYEKNAD